MSLQAPPGDDDGEEEEDDDGEQEEDEEEEGGGSGSALRENANNSILGFKMGTKIFIFQVFTLLTNYFTMPIVSGT